MGIDTGIVNFNRGTTHADDFVTIGELQRTPAVIPSKGLGESAVVLEASTVGGAEGRGAYDELRNQFTDGATAAADGEPRLSGYEQALRTNAEIEAHNEQLDQQISELSEQERMLRALFKDGLATGDGVLTYGELERLAQSDDARLQEAASWLIGAFEVRHSLPRKETLFGGDRDLELTGFCDGKGIDINAAQAFIASLARQRRELEGQYQKPVEVPTPSASDVSPAGTPPGGSQGTTATASPFPTQATPAGNLEGAMGNINHAISALEKQIAAESDKAAAGDADAAKRLVKLQAQLQTLTSVASILAAMISNLAKVYSEMAMTSVRNMK